MLIVVGSYRSSPGATSLALALAATWPRLGPRPLLIEADPAGGVIGAWWHFTEFPGLWSLAADVNRAEAWRPREHAMRLGLDLDVVACPAGEDPKSVAIVAEAAARTPADDIVIVDIGRLDRHGPAAGFLSAADHVVIVSRCTEVDLAAVHARTPSLRQSTDATVWLATTRKRRYSSPEVLASLDLPHLGHLPKDRWGASVVSGRMWTWLWRRLRLPAHAAVLARRLHEASSTDNSSPPATAESGEGEVS
ncbi:CpaE-like family protein [Catellatospora paridis]|uniref:hypothetical protein n=1 Tax=Catellatospora paridis TaxID=1617086 RepID=UPI0012D428D5|nr:hypothetical protein [Catellatospora paridis]